MTKFRALVLAGLVGTAQLPFASSTYAAGSTPTTTPSSGPGANKNVVTFGTQTSSATKPDSRGYYSFGATPGGLISDHVAILNYSNQPITVLLRGVDAVNTPQGGFAAVPVNEKSKDLGTWVALPSSDLTMKLPPRTDVIVPFEVEVPKTASPGDHFAVLTATLESSIVSKSGQHIQLLQTVGTRIFLRVSGPLHPAIAVENLRVRYHGTANPVGTGDATISYTVANTGNVGLGGKQTVYVSGLFGSKKVAAHVKQVQLLLPGFSVKQTVSVSGIVPEGLDHGHVTISALYIPGTVQPASGPFSATVSFWAVPWTLLAIVVLVIALLVLWLLLRRRRRTRPAKEGPDGSSDSPAAVPTPDGASANGSGPTGDAEEHKPVPVNEVDRT